jgi:hypothetical protein
MKKINGDDPNSSHHAMETQCVQQYCFNLLREQFLAFSALLETNMKNQNQYRKI